jgi:hypothetical protein
MREKLAIKLLEIDGLNPDYAVTMLKNKIEAEISTISEQIEENKKFQDQL